MIFRLVSIFAIKILDNILQTYKTISVHKNQRIRTSILSFLLNVMFFFVIAEVITNGNLADKVIICIASSIGTYLGFSVDDKLSTDRLYIYIVSSNDIEIMKSLGDYIRNAGISIETYDSYTDDLQKTLSAKVFCHTKEESRILNKYIEDNKEYKFLKELM